MDISSILTDPNKMNLLATQFDPTPILKELGGSVDAEGNFTPRIPMTGAGSANAPYMQMLGQASQNMTQDGSAATGGGVPGGAPLDPRMLGSLNSMMPQPHKAQFVGGASPHAGVPVNIQIPDISKLVNIHLGHNQSAPPVPTLGSLIGAR